MKRIKQTSTKLIFRDLSLDIFTIIWALGFMGIPLFMGYITLSNSGSIVFSCERIEPTLVNCQSQKNPLLGGTQTKKYDFVTGAKYEVEQTTDSEGNVQTESYVLLITKQGNFPIFQSWISVNGVKGDPEKAQNYANRINQFLQSQKTSITIEKGSERIIFLVLGFLSIFLIIGLKRLPSQGGNIRTLRIDKNNGKFDRRCSSLFGFTLSRETGNIEEIQTVKIKKIGSSFVPVIIIESGNTYDLSQPTKNKILVTNQVNRVRDFLGLDLLPVPDTQASLQPPILSQLERVEAPKTYEGRASLTFLESAIAEIARQDIYAEEEQTRLSRKSFLLSFIITLCVGLEMFISFCIVGIILDGFSIFNSFLLFFLVPGFVILIIGIIVMEKQDEIDTKVKDYERYIFTTCRHRYQVLANLIQVWKKDIKPRKAINLQLDLRTPTHSSKFQEQRPHPHKENFNINFYQDPWLRTQGYFIDGTRFQLEIIDHFQLRFGENKNGNPRIEPSFKAFEVLLVLKFPTHFYSQGLSFLQNQAEAAISLPTTAILKRIDVTSEQLKLKVKLPSPNPKFARSEGAGSRGGSGSLSRHPKTGGVDPEDAKGSYSVNVFLKNLKQHPDTTSAIIPASDEEDLNQRQALLFQTINLMFLSAYQILNLARSVSHQSSN